MCSACLIITTLSRKSLHLFLFLDLTLVSSSFWASLACLLPENQMKTNYDSYSKLGLPKSIYYWWLSQWQWGDNCTQLFSLSFTFIFVAPRFSRELKQCPLVEIFPSSHHRSGWCCIDVVRRIYWVVTLENDVAKLCICS